MDANKNITATFLQNIYAWNQTGSAAWTTGTNWTPTRFASSTTDVLMFNNGATTTATGVPAPERRPAVHLEAAPNVTLTVSGGSDPQPARRHGRRLHGRGRVDALAERRGVVQHRARHGHDGHGQRAASTRIDRGPDDHRAGHQLARVHERLAGLVRRQLHRQPLRHDEPDHGPVPERRRVRADGGQQPVRRPPAAVGRARSRPAAATASKARSCRRSRAAPTRTSRRRARARRRRRVAPRSRSTTMFITQGTMNCSMTGQFDLKGGDIVVSTGAVAQLPAGQRNAGGRRSAARRAQTITVNGTTSIGTNGPSTS